MADPKIKVLVDAEQNKGTLDLLVNGNIETTYTYQSNGKFKFSERLNPAVLSFDALEKNVSDIKTWFELVLKYCTGYDTSWTKQKLVVDDKANYIEVSLKTDAEPMITATYSKTSKQVTFDARPELTFTASDVRNWIGWLETILKSMAEHQKL